MAPRPRSSNPPTSCATTVRPVGTRHAVISYRPPGGMTLEGDWARPRRPAHLIARLGASAPPFPGELGLGTPAADAVRCRCGCSFVGMAPAAEAGRCARPWCGSPAGKGEQGRRRVGVSHGRVFDTAAIRHRRGSSARPSRPSSAWASWCCRLVITGIRRIHHAQVRPRTRIWDPAPPSIRHRVPPCPPGGRWWYDVPASRARGPRRPGTGCRASSGEKLRQRRLAHGAA